MLLKYPLTAGQYARFQHSTNDAEIRALCERAGCRVTDEQIVNGVETWYFRGRCAGTMALVPCSSLNANMVEFIRKFPEVKPHHWECWIRIQSKPWWLPWAVLGYGFRRALV